MRKVMYSLFRKKGWTGKELGKLLFSSMYHDIKDFQNPNHKPLFDQKDFDNMVYSLEKDKDWIQYGIYSTLYSSLTDAFNKGQGQEQQFNHGFQRLLNIFTQCLHSDSALRSLENTPLIMTEKQYNRLERKARRDLEAFKESFCGLVFSCLEYFLENEESAPDDIKDALEACKKKPSKGNSFLPRYNEVYHNGYNELPDGSRSDKLTEEEWQGAIKNYYLNTHELILSNGEKANFEETLSKFNQIRQFKLYELLFKGVDAVRGFYKDKVGVELTKAEGDKLLSDLEALADGIQHESPILEKLLPYLDYNNFGSWHMYKEPPEDLTLYDLLGMYIEEYQSGNEKETLKLLKKDAPALYKAITAYIESRVSNAKEVKARQIYSPLVSFGELASLHFLSYKEYTKPRNENIIDAFIEENGRKKGNYYYRVFHNGIAIVKDPQPWQMNANGDYKEETSYISFFENLDDLETNEKKIQEIEDCAKYLFKPALRYLYAFNALLGVLGRVYDLPELQETASFDTGSLATKVSSYNDLIYYFYNNAYGDKKEKERKRDIIKEIFKPVDVEELKPTEEAIHDVEAYMQALGMNKSTKLALRSMDAYINRLSRKEEV